MGQSPNSNFTWIRGLGLRQTRFGAILGSSVTWRQSWPSMRSRWNESDQGRRAALAISSHDTRNASVGIFTAVVASPSQLRDFTACPNRRALASDMRWATSLRALPEDHAMASDSQVSRSHCWKSPFLKPRLGWQRV